ncbi:hypothetical protein [Haladaptatus sp. DYF46]|nr:hypothetical protein [Haladaptatus sp. DYF46]
MAESATSLYSPSTKYPARRRIPLAYLAPTNAAPFSVALEYH